MKVKIRIKTTQRMEDGDVQTIESFYNGERLEKKGNTYVTFKKFENGKESKSIIKIAEDEVLIMQSGEIRSNMRFSDGKQYITPYETVYGIFDMMIYTYKVVKKVTDEEIKINLDYKISIRGLLDANNRIEIRINPES